MDDIYQPEALLEKIEEATISEALRSTLEGLVTAFGHVLPKLSNLDRYLMSYNHKFLIEEIVAEETETHWWELHLDLLRHAAGTVPAGRPFLDAAAALPELANAHLGPQENIVTLQEITNETVRGICRLSDTLRDPQDLFVAPNAYSLAQAHFNQYAWFRAVYAGKTPVGFLMLSDNDDKQEYFLWRYMIAAPYQGRGYGRRAIDLLVDYVRTRPGAQKLLVSCVPHPAGPYDFYVKCGFVDTGEVHDGEVVMDMEL